jgi:hypothetical protein
MSKIKYSNKKFYNKWIYKVSLTLKGCGIFRNNSFDDIKAYCSGKENTISFYDYQSYALKNKDTVVDIVNFLEKHNSIQYAKRIERHFIDFYTNDIDFYNDFLKEFDSIVRHGVEPLPGHTADILNSSSIFTKKLPHGKYKFKVFLLPHKLRNNKEQKQNFINWATTQDTRIRMSDAVKHWFLTTDWNWDRRYILVEDEGTLLMLKLRNSDVVGKVHEYQIVDK